MSREPAFRPRVPRLIVVGSGIAGLYASLLAVDSGASVVLLTKGELNESNTWYAQGGISAVLDRPAPGDTIAAHVQDTLQAGAGHCDAAAVQVLCTEARHDIAGLQRFGAHFDIAGDGGPALGLEAAHSAPRILHAGGDATGARIAAALIRSVLARQADGKITLLSGAQATALRLSSGRVDGVEYLRDGRQHTLMGDALLLATGGAGQVFAQTTNPAVATADGLALAVRAGAAVADLEFFQFHPTCLAQEGRVQEGGVQEGWAEEAGATRDTNNGLNGEPLLISEAVRGEGAVLVDAGGRRFMTAYHRDAELAPRDVVSRSIALHLAKLGDPNGHVYLDARVIEQAKGPGFLARRFPTLTRRILDAGFDWTRDLVPVAPAAHYWMGGVVTDLLGRTTVPGLYAAGEVACTGVQGANRLASNSLLEGLVFGRRAVESFLFGGSDWGAPGGAPPRTPHDPPNLASSADEGLAPSELFPSNTAAEPGVSAGSTAASSDGGKEVFSREALRRLMTAKAGVLRSGKLLTEAAETLDRWTAVVHPDAVPAGNADPVGHEDRNLLLAARLLVAAALDRTESLGAHYRSDEPEEAYALRPKASLVRD
nr:FAD-binding protein [Pseudarthrobacter sp. NamE5]